MQRILAPLSQRFKMEWLKDIIPQKSDYNPTMMLKAMVDRVYSDSRVKYPCVRKSFLENKKTTKNCAGEKSLCV
ncbi:hypothetical protein HpMMM94_13430 [Helicobacter pylori]